LFYGLHFVAFAAYFNKTLWSVLVNCFSRGRVWGGLSVWNY